MTLPERWPELATCPGAEGFPRLTLRGGMARLGAAGVEAIRSTLYRLAREGVIALLTPRVAAGASAWVEDRAAH